MKKIGLCFFLILCLQPALAQDSTKQNLIVVVDLEGGVSPAITNKLSVFRLRLRLKSKQTAYQCFVLALESLHYTPPNRPEGFSPGGLFATEPKNLVFTIGLGGRYTLLQRPAGFRLSLEDSWVLGQYNTHEFIPNQSRNSFFSFGGTHQVISTTKALVGKKIGLAFELIPFKFMALQGSCLANLNTQRSYLAWTVGLCFGVLR